ncbi:hypothetical protein E4U91_13480 [Streptomyces lasalocidi]|uniref:Uncharacterized protein n=1 Tax=Streptomyces lasalocidi TaxID=324833 RepID=A0A4U5WGF9_STRLS|nr:hypothetical protein E4U91_13480 [Streptomyces lasalocidi]
MWCAFLHADPGLSSAADRVSIPPDDGAERAVRACSCLAGGRRLGGAPDRTYGWCSSGGREDLSRPQH